MSQNGNHPGRPRDPRVDDALLRAGLEVFLSSGYHAATLTEIARRAKVSKPAIYRRWPNKSDMAIDTVEMRAQPEPIPDTGSIRRDLTTFLKFRIELWNTPFFRRLLLPLILESTSDQRLAQQVGARFRTYRTALDDRVRRAIASGELRRDTDPTLLIDLLMGAVTMPLLFSQEALEETEAGAIVDRMLDGFKRPAKRSRMAAAVATSKRKRRT